MPNKKSAIKHLRQTKKLTARNSLVKRNIKELIKQGEKAIAKETVKEQSAKLVHDLQKAVDKAVKTGALKANTGDRKKSRFAKLLKKSGASTEATKKAASKTEEKKATKK